MPKPAKNSGVILAGAYEVDLGARELRRGSQRVELEDLPFDVLVLLLDRHGKLVPRQQLREKLWPADAPADPQRSLDLAIRRLKSALGDTATTPGYIEVVPDSGYRFVARVSKRHVGAATRPAPWPGPSGFKLRKKWVLGFTLACALVAAGKFAYDRWTASSQARIKLAVLPFKCLSGSTADNPMCDGLTEEIIGRLGKVSSARLGVIAATSVWRFRNTEQSVQEIGRSLGVDKLVEGSVAHEGGQVRISAKLIQVEDETQMWSETYTRDYADLLTLEREVAVRVVEALIPKLPGFRAQAARPGTENAPAHEAYVRGRYAWRMRSAAGFQQSIQFYNEAIRLDPNYAQAYAGIADTYDAMGFYGMLPPAASYEKAREAAKTALKLDDSLADAHAALAEVLLHYDYDWEGAGREFQRAIQREDNNANAHEEYAVYLALRGKESQGRKELDRAHELDPFFLVIAANWTLHYFYAGNYDEAIRKGKEAVNLEPAFALGHFWLGRAYQAAGQPTLAIAELDEATRREPGIPLYQALLGHAYGAAGRREEALAVLNGLQAASRKHPISPVLFSLIYVGLGDKDRALTLAEEAFAERAPLLTRIKRDPILSSLRQDPRFIDLVRRVGPPD